ncbi:hypothetical protein Taro_022644 [Colocasia esculenta]|uniref:RRM domain-containing protein n=1 Tax=Colocasia esculenta TaxID=4460 RepID=A0A843V2G1_COLES|nr:hypothetical protein [Colocasia esculenta]
MGSGSAYRVTQTGPDRTRPITYISPSRRVAATSFPCVFHTSPLPRLLPAASPLSLQISAVEMPPRRSSAGAKKRVVKTVRSTRNSAAAAAAEPEENPALEAPEETPISETPAAAEAPVVETPAAADEVSRGSPTPSEIIPKTAENPTLGTPASVEPAAAGETAATMDVDAAGTPIQEVIPQAPEAPASADETKAHERVTVTEDDKVTTGCPAPDITPQDASLEDRPADPVPRDGTPQGEEARVVGAAEATTGVAGAVPVVKKITKRVRKVMRRVPVKRIPNKKEPEPAAGKEDEGDEGGEETAPLPAEKEQNSRGAQPVSVPIKKVNSTGAEAAPMSVEGQNPNGAETVPMSVEGENPSGAEAVSITVEEHKPVSGPDQPPAPGEPTSHAEATASADGCPPVVVLQKRVRKVKKIIVVKRPVKAKGGPKKEEKTEEAGDGKRVAQKEEKEAHEGTVEKVADPGSDANPNEPSKDDKSDSKTEIASVPDGSLKTEEDVAPESREDDSEKGESSRSVDAELEKVEGEDANGITAADQMVGMSERQKRRKTEIFIGGLDREAKEVDIRKVFEKVGEVVEVRMMIDKKTGKNKGYAFLRYATPAQAKQAVIEFSKVEWWGHPSLGLGQPGPSLSKTEATCSDDDTHMAWR